MRRWILAAVVGLMPASLLVSCRSSSDITSILPNDSTLTGREVSAPVQTDALRYSWTRAGIWWSTTIPIAFHNLSFDTVHACSSPAYPVLLQKRVNARWVAYVGRAVLDSGCQRYRDIPPGATMADTLRITAAAYGQNAGPAFAGPDIDGVYRMVLGGFYSRLAQGQPQPGDTLRTLERISNPFVMRADTAL